MRQYLIREYNTMDLRGGSVRSFAGALFVWSIYLLCKAFNAFSLVGKPHGNVTLLVETLAEVLSAGFVLYTSLGIFRRFRRKRKAKQEQLNEG